MPPRSHARAGEREREREPLPPAAERVHPHAVAGGWRVWKCHFRGWQHLRAVKIFPLARATTYGPKRKRALFSYKKRADLLGCCVIWRNACRQHSDSAMVLSIVAFPCTGARMVRSRAWTRSPILNSLRVRDTLRICVRLIPGIMTRVPRRHGDRHGESKGTSTKISDLKKMVLAYIENDRKQKSISGGFPTIFFDKSTI